MRKLISLVMLVVANILSTALILFLAILGYSTLWLTNPLFNPGVFAVAGIASAQLLVLATVTAFHDPRVPVSRWLFVGAVLAGAIAVLAIEALLTSHWIFERLGYTGPLSWPDGYVTMICGSAAGILAILAGCLALVLVFHIGAWPLRTMLGWRLVRLGEPDASGNTRQFGITHLMAWIGLSASLLWLLRTLWQLRTAAGAFEMLGPLVAVVALVVVSLLFVLPWTYLLFVSKTSFWPFLVGFGAVAALSYLAQEAIAQFNFTQINSSTSVAGALLLPSLQVAEFGAFGGTATLAAALNFLMLRQLGFRFQSAKANSPSLVVSSSAVASPLTSPSEPKQSSGIA